MTQNQAKAFAEALKKRFDGEVEFEPVNDRGRYRFAITSGQFEKMTHLQRQDEVWKVADATLPRDAILDVSVILAFAPADLPAMS